VDGENGIVDGGESSGREGREGPQKTVFVQLEGKCPSLELEDKGREPNIGNHLSYSARSKSTPNCLILNKTSPIL